MSTACQLFRQRWLDRFALAGDPVGAVVDGRDEHCEGCPDCSAWHLRLEQQVGALRTLERLLAPAALEELVTSELELASEELALEAEASQRRSVEAIRHLTPHRAPAALEALVAARLTEPASVRALRGLTPCPAPRVLDRLVDERLHDPAKAQAQGWVGTLERKTAPRTLDASLDRGLHGRFGAQRLGWSLAAAAAVSLFAGAWWFRGGDASPEVARPGASPVAAARPFEVLHTDDATPLDAMTRSLRDLLTPVAAIDPQAEPLLELLPEELRTRLQPGRRIPLTGSPPASAGQGGSSGSTSAATSGAGGAGITGSASPPFGLIAENLFDSVALRGERQITFFDPFGSVLQFVAYGERITTDGKGRFLIEPTQVLTPVRPDPLLFRFLMENRQGFLYRYRDFAVRDAAAFQRNYTVAYRPQGSTLLGRPVSIMDVRRRDGSAHFEVWTDIETGLVLNYLTRDASGAPLVWMKFKSLDLSPDLSDVTFYQPKNEEVVLGTGPPIKSQTGGQTPSRPKLLPPGYALLEQATVTDPDSGQLWIKTTYTDGVRPLFFLERVRRRSPGATGNENRLPRGRAGDPVLVDELGGVSSAHARIGNEEFIAVGYVSVPELLDLVQSAL